MGVSQSSCEAPASVLVGGEQPRQGTEAQAAAAAPVKATTSTQPVKYDDLAMEAYRTLKWESLEGLEVKFMKPMNKQQNFAVSHRLMLGMKEVDVADPSKAAMGLRLPSHTYQFSAHLVGEKGIAMGTMDAAGVLSTRAIFKPMDAVTLKHECRISPDSYNHPQFMMDVDYAGADFNMQAKYGMAGFYGCNFMQNISKHFSAGGELFYLSQQRKSGVGFVLRAADERHVATVQLATTGIVAAAYYRKINEKHALAADFLWNLGPNEATANLGYDCQFAKTRVRGSVSSDFKVMAYVEERISPFAAIVFSGEIDHAKGDHKFGFGLSVGE